MFFHVSGQDPALNQAITELRTLLERFANGQPIQSIIDAANILIDDANRDPELRDWFKDVDAYVRKVCFCGMICDVLSHLPSSGFARTWLCDRASLQQPWK